MTTPHGAFITGYFFGKIYNTVKKYGIIDKIKNSVNDLVESIWGKMDLFFEKHGPDIDFIYNKLKKIDYAGKVRTFLYLIHSLLNSFTPAGMIKGLIKRGGAKAIGGLAWTALKTALIGSAGGIIAAAGGPWMLGLMAVGAVAELGLLFWERWSEKKKIQSDDKYKRIKGGKSAELTHKRLKINLKGKKKIYGSRSFLEDNFDLFTFFKSDNKTPKEGVDFGKLDKSWLSDLIQQLKSGAIDVEKEQRLIEII